MNYAFIKRDGLVKLDRTKLTKVDTLLTYHGKTDTLLNEVLRDAIMCTDVNCNEISHGIAFRAM